MVSRFVIAILVLIAVAAIGSFFTLQPPKTSFVEVTILKDSSYKLKVPEGLRPKDVVVVLGINNSLRWTNNDPGVVHTITSDLPEFDSGFLDPGKTFTYAFAKPGTYAYHCELHLWVVGKIDVRAK